MTKFSYLPDSKELPRIHTPTLGTYLPGLRRARIVSGLSQASLAREAQVSPTTVQQLEKLRRGGYPKTIRKLSQALNVEPLDLMPQLRSHAREGDGHA